MTDKESRKHGLDHGDVRVQMEINRSNATAGGSGADVAASAIISVLVTLNGEPVDDLGANAGTASSAINLPAGWVLRDGFNVRPWTERPSRSEVARWASSRSRSPEPAFRQRAGAAREAVLAG